ncbi:MAG: hypothetical protein LBF51_03175 [Zoogloeaceae bacterium]|jgi:hypothetical protein|nr:hypothetical protein [Zoogloeaceae bacterium]
MLSRLWSHLQSRVRAHEEAGRHGRFAHERFMPPVCAGGDAVLAPVASAMPARCPLCDKDCALDAPRCKHGAAFVQFLRGARGGARHV